MYLEFLHLLSHPFHLFTFASPSLPKCHSLEIKQCLILPFSLFVSVYFIFNRQAMAVDTEAAVTALSVTSKAENPDTEKSHQSEIAADATPAEEQNQTPDDSEAEPSKTKETFGFYAIIVALALTSLLTSLEATITSTALPTVTADLGGASLYVWVVNGYYLTQ